MDMGMFTWVAVALEIMLLLGVVYFGTKASHKIAGPVFVIKRSLDTLSGGDLSCRARLRRNDNLQDLCESFNAAAGRLDLRISEIKHEFEMLGTLLEQGKDTDEQMETIRQKLEYFNRASEDG